MAVAATGPSLLGAQVTRIVDAPPLDQVHWGIHAVDAATGRILVDHQARKKFIPASNQKLLVTAAALHALGPGHRFETMLLGTGTFDPVIGILDGDLVLPGTGDPTLSARFWEDDAAPLRALADSLRRAGIREVTGSLVVDASAWDSTTLVGSWEVGDLPSTTAATGGAFTIGEGVTAVTLAAGALPGEPARVTWAPRGEDDFVISRVQTVAAGASSQIQVGFLPQSRQLVLEGTIPRGGRRTLRVAARDPVRQSTAALERALSEAGITVRGGWRIAWSPGEPLEGGCRSGDIAACRTTRLASLVSPPLIEIVKAVLEPSQNWIAEQLVRSLGLYGAETARAGAVPNGVVRRAGWREGLAVVRAHLVDVVGVDSLDLQLRDGSGLSAQNLVTPRALVRLLDHARRAPWGSSFEAALPEPGEEDSTLENRLQGLEGRVYAKTGSITNVATLSGYLRRADGSTVIFSILSNGAGLPSSLLRDAIDRMVRELASAR